MTEARTASRQFPSRPGWQAGVIWIAAIALGYFVTARLSLLLLIEPAGIAAVWPASGLFLSALLLTRRDLRPWLAGALGLTDLACELLAGTPPLVSALYALILTGDAVSSAWLIRRFLGEAFGFGRIRDVVGWFLLALLFSNSLAGLAAAGASQLLPGTTLWGSWWSWVAADGIGNLLVTPLILSWVTWGGKGRWFRSWRRTLEGAALYLLLAGLNYLAFFQLPAGSQSTALLSYLNFPFLLWAALRFGTRGVSTASLILAAVALLSTVTDDVVNLFHDISQLQELLAVQLFVALVAAPALVLAAVMEERRQITRALRESELRWRFAIEGTGDGFWDWDVSAGTVFFSRRWKEMLGYQDGDIGTGLDEWSSRVHPDDLARATADVRAHLDGVTPIYLNEQRLRCKDGGWKWILDRGLVISRSEDGKPLRAVGTHTDVTDRRLAEERSRDASAYARSLIEASLDPLVTISHEGKITDVNRATEEATGRPRDRLIGTDFADSFTEPEKARAGYLQALGGGALRDYPLTLRHASGRTVEVRFNATVYADGRGEIKGVFATARDVTQINLLQAQLATASRLAAMGTLVAGVAHEINNPLSVDLGTSSLLLRQVAQLLGRLRGDAPLDRAAEIPLLEGWLESLRDAQAAGQRIHRIVKDLATFGNPGARRRRFTLSEVVEAAVRWLPSDLALATDIRLERGADLDVLSAPGQLEQVLVNLITNAAMASPAGAPAPITIRYGPGSPGMARFEVVDQGVGIAPAIRDRIFEPFFSTRDVGQGRGMGLSVSHAIVTGHGGTISVESAVGTGSTFRVELPAAPADA